MTVRAVVAACALLMSTLVSASNLSEFHAAVADAYGFYRSAVFYLRTGNAMVAGFELAQMQQRWDEVARRFGPSPPDAYGDDAGFAHTLDAIGTRVDTAVEAAAAGDAPRAGEALAPIRDLLSTLRARAGVRVFSDCVNDVNDAMRALYVYRREPVDLEAGGAVNEVKGKAAVVRYLLARCDTEATAVIRGDQEFRRLVDGMRDSADSLVEALDRKDATAVINILREMRSFDRILFLRFG